ncbi:uncharacterized protein MYCFIDRAFT_175194 [Pseudocercospora fijiensis CIRAD86]|uniref:Uncharacterized protein n=1 Tax=Pseudocercospora fijiensis (strain CIRAD86) TaxID=383855 RepID=M2YV46_PSEFD|nr:uncharacterized protein MYCFIDRAFT_175194 [Pseudocercospora fijiensis CIRAD86]EME81600.1 hypothetical protein MYCFIDRAFT_175194 [Pseudocercospora fijiensis CIRAD86]
MNLSRMVSSKAYANGKSNCEEDSKSVQNMNISSSDWKLHLRLSTLPEMDSCYIGNLLETGVIPDRFDAAHGTLIPSYRNLTGRARRQLMVNVWKNGVVGRCPESGDRADRSKELGWAGKVGCEADRFGGMAGTGCDDETEDWLVFGPWGFISE